MKIRKIKYALFILILLLLAAGCQNSITEKDEKTDKNSNPVKLDWYVNYSWFKTVWGKNEVSKAITDHTGVDIDYQIPKGNETDKLNAMIASDTLPDLVTIGWWETQNQEIIDKGQVYSLNDLARKYDPGFFDVLDESAVKWYTKSDGKIYGYPNSSYSPEDFKNNQIPSNQNFLVRKDIYETIGSPDMTTPEGFSDAVRKAYKTFPKVDENPLIPIGSDEFNENGANSFDQYLQAFLAVPYEEDGKYYDRNTDPEYLRWLKMFRQLGKEGYLKDEIFIDKRSQLESKLANGQYFCLFYQNTDIKDQVRTLNEKDPDSIYIPVEGPRNSKGDDPVLPVPGVHGWTVTYITKNCKDPKKALELIKYLISEEGQKMTYLGVEGSMYQMKDNRPVINPEVKKLLETDRKAYDAKYGADNTFWMLQDNVMQLKWSYEEDDPISAMKRWTYPYATYTAQYDMNFDENIKAAVIYKNQQKLWGDTLPRLLLAENDEEFDRILADYKEKREANGYETFVQEANERFQKNKELFGME